MTKLNSENRLSRNLGLLTTFAIAIGAMVGPGIFGLLDFIYLEFGIGIIYSYLLAGFLALITAFSLAEMTTGFSRGGIYYFVSRSLGMSFGIIIGFGTWIALAAKGAFALRGLARYSEIIIPLPALIVIVLSGISLLLLNYKGLENSITLQFLVLSFLLVGLSFFLVRGLNLISLDSLTTNIIIANTDSVFMASGFVFITYLALAQIALLSDEVRNPNYNLPFVFIVSVVFITILIIAIIVIINSLQESNQLMLSYSPLLETVGILAGDIAKNIMVVAGFLATLITVNATLLSSSRLPFSMGRDNLLPEFILKIHKKYGTPYLAILMTGGMILLLFISFSMEQLVKIASIFNLLIFILINLSVITLRTRVEENYKPDFKTPFFPIFQFIAIIISFLLLFTFDYYYILFILVTSFIAILWFRLYGVKQDLPEYNFFDILESDKIPTDPKEEEKKVLVPVSNPEHENDLLWLANALGDVVIGLNIIKVPSQTELWLAKEKQLSQKNETCQRLKRQFEEAILDNENSEYLKKIKQKTNYLVVFAHQIAGAILEQADREDVDLIIMGWKEKKRSKLLMNNITNKVLSQSRKDIAFLNGNLPNNIKEITVSYKGGPNSEYGLYLAQRLTLYIDAKINILKIVRSSLNQKERREVLVELKEEIESKLDNTDNISYKIKSSSLVVDGILEAVTETDLMIIGDSLRRFKRSYLGDLSRQIIKETENAVLIVKRYRPISKETINSLFSKIINQIMN